MENVKRKVIDAVDEAAAVNKEHKPRKSKKSKRKMDEGDPT
jgi:hypothetical protein